MTERLGSFAKRVLAVLVLLVVAWLVLKVIIGVATAIAWVVVAIAAVVAALWAIRTLRR